MPTGQGGLKKGGDVRSNKEQLLNELRVLTGRLKKTLTEADVVIRQARGIVEKHRVQAIREKISKIKDQ